MRPKQILLNFEKQKKQKTEDFSYLYANGLTLPR